MANRPLRMWLWGYSDNRYLDGKNLSHVMTGPPPSNYQPPKPTNPVGWFATTSQEKNLVLWNFFLEKNYKITEKNYSIV